MVCPVYYPSKSGLLCVQQKINKQHAIKEIEFNFQPSRNQIVTSVILYNYMFTQSAIDGTFQLCFNQELTFKKLAIMKHELSAKCY